MTDIRLARFAIVFPTVLAAFACLAFVARPASAAFPGANGQVAFTRNNDIYVMNPNGTGQVNRTANAALDTDPAWSPGGTKIAFTSNRDGNNEIYSMNADGTGVMRLTNDTGSDFRPAWSPDGTRIAFTSFRDGNEEVYVMNADGTGPVNRSNNGAQDQLPVWSPDGTKIAFVSLRDGNPEIYVMNADGTGQARLTINSGPDVSPDWSPDGTKIAFETVRASDQEIYTMNADGTNQVNRTNAPDAFDMEPAWSPDGTKIVFRSDLNTGFDIYTINADGTGLVQLTFNVVADTLPDWGSQTAVIGPGPYDTPGSAPSLKTSLVPVFRQCGTGANPTNGSPGPPLSGTASSCSPAAIPGTVAAHFGKLGKGSAELTVVPDDPDTVPDESDVAVVVSAADVRLGTRTGPDYLPNPSGADLTMAVRTRSTDTNNCTPSGCSGNFDKPATLVDSDLLVPIDCQATADLSRGADCSAGSSVDALFGAAAIQGGKGGIGQLFRVRLNDAGPDAIAGNADDALFAQEGVAVHSEQRIAFDSNVGGNDDIYVLNPDGTPGTTRLTTDPSVDHDPSISPDGQRIVFISNRGGANFEIYKMNADGTGQTPLTANTALDARPVWSPDGQKIAFYSNRDGNEEIYTMNADGTNQNNITNNSANDDNPSWSPNGTKIIFDSNRLGPRQIFSVNADGTGTQNNLTNTSFDSASPEWSPDGTKITFDRMDSDREVYVMNADGTSQTNVSNAAGTQFEPDWSSDGGSITFTQNVSPGNDEIHKMPATGPGPGTTLIAGGVSNRRPDWGVGPSASAYDTPGEARQIDTSLVPVFRQCGTAGNPTDSAHNAPLSLPSCNPPGLTGGVVAHTGAQGISSAKLTVMPARLAAGNQADVAIEVRATDVRSGSSTGADYDVGSSDLTLIERWRLTGSDNCTPLGCAGPYNQPGTTTDFDLKAPVNCVPNPSAAIGSNCAVVTSANAIYAGMIKETSPSAQLFRLRLTDSGPDGIRNNSDDKLFMQQGIFIP